MENTSTTALKEGEDMAGRLAYVQFTNKLSNLIECEILPEGWERSADALAKIISKKNLPKFKKALHRAILEGFNDSLKEMLSPVDLPKKWQVLNEEVSSSSDQMASYRNHKMTLMSLKLQQRNALMSLIEEKKKKIEEIKQQIIVDRLMLSRKKANQEEMKLNMNKNIDLLEKCDSMNF